MRIHIPLSFRRLPGEDKPSCRLTLPQGVNYENTARIYPTGSMPGFIGVDFELVPDEGRNEAKIIWLREWREFSPDVPNRQDETWYLEVDLEQAMEQAPDERLEDRVRQLRQLFQHTMQSAANVSREGLFRQAIQVAMTMLLEPTRWARWEPDGKYVSPYPEPEAGWEGLAEQSGQYPDTRLSAEGSRWRTRLILGNSGELYIEGIRPEPGEANFRRFSEFVAYCAKEMKAREMETGDIESASSPEPPSDPSAMVAEPLKELLSTIRHELAALIRKHVKTDISKTEVPPLSILFLSATENGKGFQYNFDREQQQALKALRKNKTITEEHYDLLIKTVTAVAPDAVRSNKPEMSGLTWAVRESRAAIVLPWQTMEKKEAADLGYNPEFRKAEDSAFTGGKGPIPWFIAVPVITETGTKTEEKEEVGLIVYFAAQPDWPPLTPELSAALIQAVMSKSSAISAALIQDDHARNFAQYEFVRSLSYFMGHNLPKATTTPLLNIARQLRSDCDRAALDRLAARIEAIAGLTQSMLRALDLFRTPGSLELKPEEVALGGVLEKVELVFTELLESRSRAIPSLARVKERVRLEIAMPPGEIPIKAFEPTLLHALLIPVDNALQALDLNAIQEDAGRGVIRVAVTRNEQGETRIEVIDGGKGVEKEKLKKIRERLDAIPHEAEQGRGINFARRPSPTHGSNLGIGMMLCAFTMAVLQDREGNRGAVEIESPLPEGQPGTRVVMRIPDNSAQESIKY